MTFDKKNAEIERKMYLFSHETKTKHDSHKEDYNEKIKSLQNKHKEMHTVINSLK